MNCSDVKCHKMVTGDMQPGSQAKPKPFVRIVYITGVRTRAHACITSFNTHSHAHAHAQHLHLTNDENNINNDDQIAKRNCHSQLRSRTK